MSVSGIGNTILVNQMTVNTSAIQNAHNNRVDFQNMVAQASVNEKDEKVLEVRPAEENHEIDPDREHTKNEADQETKRDKKQENEEEDTEIEPKKFTKFKLDIMV
ncbi:MAG: hypothetical protein U9P72_08350 [Campylobacterota bacterium]|nr:hypothetical protein [Campylobacterota bacterium]